MRATDYPRPPQDTGIGFHWFPDYLHDRNHDLDNFLPHLRGMGVRWLVLLSRPDEPLQEAFVRRLLTEGIEPIVRLYTPTVAPLDQAMLRRTAERYAEWGVHYLHVYNEPNLKYEWDEWEPEGLPERFMELLLPCLETFHSVEGIIPVFTPMAPGGNYSDLLFLDECLEVLARPAHRHLTERLALAIHNYPGNKPLTWGAGGRAAWPCATPYHCPPGCEDHVGFRQFEWYNEIVVQHLGRSLPLLATEGGPQPGVYEHHDYPPVDLERHAEGSFAMASAVMHGALPDCLFNICFWLLSAAENRGFANQRWFLPDGTPALPLSVTVLKGMAKGERPRPRALPEAVAVLQPGGKAVEVSLEDYVAGVVSALGGEDLPAEARRALAIAARSLAAAATLAPRHGPVPLCAQEHCQPWRAELAPAAQEAAQQTAAVVLLDDGVPAAAFHFPHCDGQTRSAREAWGREIAYCQGAPCTCTEMQPDGHGVGLCRQGAVQMALEGADAEQILGHYYGGLSLSAPARPSPSPAPRPQPWIMTVVRHNGPRRIVGRLPRADIQVTVADPFGNAVKLRSGDKPELGAGGFEMLAWSDGPYRIWFLEQSFVVEVQDDWVEVSFQERPADGGESSASRASGMDTSGPALWRTVWERRPGTPALGGLLPRPGLRLELCDDQGNCVTTWSGSDARHGAGGFHIPLWKTGSYCLHVGGQVIPVQVGEGEQLTVVLRPCGGSDPAAPQVDSLPGAGLWPFLAAIRRGEDHGGGG
ncbi:MAG: hypothetical protein GX605_09625 [Chloroflexi bacterium]|nr:hypothetical protein [Chloroflexota bacterium]